MKQHKCPVPGEWIKCGTLYNGKPFSYKKNEIMPFAAAGLELEINIVSEVSQKEKEKYHMEALIRKI